MITFPHFNTDFPLDGEYWMVTWVYLVTLKENDYYFTIDLVALKDGQVLKEAKPYRPGNYTGRHLTISTGYHFLPLTEVGSVWYNQRLIFTPSTASQAAVQLTLTIPDPQRALSVPLHTLVKGAPKLPVFHPFGHLNNELLGSSWCQVLKSNDFTIRDGERISLLVIPPAEIIRFYYCGSDSMLKQLLANGIPYDQVYLQEATRYDQDTQELFVRIRGHLQDSDALYVGRLAGDKVAHQAATALGKDIQLNLMHHKVSHLNASFPFADSTKLQVAGKWFKMKPNSTRWAFMVYSIISCSAELPFSKLLFYRENDNEQKEDSVEEKQESNQVTKEPVLPSDGAQIGSTTSPSPGFTKGRVELLVAAEDKFTTAPPVERVRKEQQLVAIKGRRLRWAVELQKYTLSGDGLPPEGEPVGRIGTDVLSDEKGKGVDFSQFSAITEQLRVAHITCQYVNYTSHNSSDSSELLDEYTDFKYPAQPLLFSPEVKRWLFLQTRLNRNDSPKQIRRVIVLQLIYSETSFYLIECQNRKSENFSRLLIKPNRLDYNRNLLLNELLRELASAKGRWSKVDVLALKIRKQAIHHGEHDTPSDVALRVIGYLKKLL